MYLSRSLGTIAALWGIFGVMAMLLYGTVRMVQHAYEATSYAWSPWQIVLLIGWAIFMAYSEGYRGFQRSFAPRVAARAVYLRERSTLLRLILAPAFCMGLIHASRKRCITVLVLMLMIVSIVIVFQYIPQPWRGILDIGVAIGLSWGILATLTFLIKFWFSTDVPFDAEVVETVLR